MSKIKIIGFANCEENELTYKSLESIMDDVFKSHISCLQKKKREKIPALDNKGHFIMRKTK